jgi:hypothetical protein
MGFAIQSRGGMFYEKTDFRADMTLWRDDAAGAATFTEKHDAERVCAHLNRLTLLVDGDPTPRPMAGSAKVVEVE